MNRGAEHRMGLSAVDESVNRHAGRPSALVPMLQDISRALSCVPPEAVRRLCALTGLSLAHVASVVSFYPGFRSRPAGRHRISVCVGTACHLAGAHEAHEEFVRQLRVPEGDDTDPDRLFTVERSACLGCCSLAPAVRIDGSVYGHVTAGRVPDVLADFLRNRERPEPSEAAVHPAPGEAPQATLCLCSACRSAGAGDVFTRLTEEIRAQSLHAAVRETACTGASFLAPLLAVRDGRGGTFHYAQARPEDVRSILLSHFFPATAVARVRSAASRLLARLVPDPSRGPVVRYPLEQRPRLEDLEPRQLRVVTEHAGLASPLDLDDYLARGGFAALKRCLHGLSPSEVIAEVAASGLRGRGGAGYPTGAKWAQVAGAAGPARHVIVNGDEGDPGAFMDRMVLESFPFRVLEGMAIASYAVGASRALVYVRGEYPLAVERVRRAARICSERGFLGPGILGTGFGLQVEVFEGAGAYVCGEETALIASVQGGRGWPRARPPYPSETGRDGLPTLVNNVETLAAVPWILSRGPQAFAAIGTETSRGTKTFALAGKVPRGGLLEVPLGTTVEGLVEGLGGAPADGWKAVLVGGPPGGCVPRSLGGLPVDFEALGSAGAVMGSGGMVVLDGRDCVVDLARYFLEFARNESCGKCPPCRVGTGRLLSGLESLCAGTARPADVRQMERLAEVMRCGSLCGLGRGAPGPFLSTLRHFRGEYEAHLSGRCPAGRCRALVRYAIGVDCIGCTRCAQRCPAGAIEPKAHEVHTIDDALCTRCDVCRQVCPVDAVGVLDRI